MKFQKNVGVSKYQMSAKDYLVGILWISIIGISNQAAGSDFSTNNPSDDGIYPILNKLYPNTDIKIVKEINKDECEIRGSQPGMVKADFNGDGKSDYAVLVQISEAKRNKKHKDKDFDGVDITLLVLMQATKGSFDKFILDKIKGYQMGFVFIDFEAPGMVRETETNRSVRFKNPGVALVYCGKSQVDFYWNGQRFNKIWVSD